MTSALEWGRAYFTQAESDWLAYRRISDTDLPHCHALHALQMVLEKLGKGLRLADGGLLPEHREQTHLSFVKCLSTAERDAGLRPFLRFSRPEHYRKFCRSLRKTADALERLQPQLAEDRPNVEYPWPTRNGVKAPARHDFVEFHDLCSASGARLLGFIGQCFAFHRATTFAAQEP